ncbi:MAG: 1,4-alpha-glucan branching protein GlgB [Janthinobacterium lividum]
MAGISQDAVVALVDGRHGDPFSILGDHRVDGERVIRAFMPGAGGIDIVAREDGSRLATLEMVHPAGLFAGPVSKAGPYRLSVHWPEAIQVIDDPYSFGLLLGDLDLHLIGQGTHYELGRCLGAQAMSCEGVAGVRFAVWAPNARRVSVVGDFNSWDGRRLPMRLRGSVGVWELFVPGAGPGTRYKYEIIGPGGNVLLQKADPVARAAEAAPATASIVARSEPFAWTDDDWQATRAQRQGLDSPISVYEVHPGSWLKLQEQGGRSLNWREMVDRLVPYVAALNFTHIEFMPIMEHPFGGSWGYQTLGLFAPTGRYGSPEDFAYFVDRCHASGIGVILDWVPAHFPTDVWGLAQFDGTPLYEHADPREGFHQDWNTLIFNLGRNEVKGFVIASALEWLERYHVDALRVDAVASMLYRDYSRKAGEWVPNKFGGRENLESVEFFRHLNSIIHQRQPGALVIAEESTAWPGVTAPVEQGGLGFDMKWNMGWMHDTLKYMEEEPIYRRYHHHLMTFGMVYAYSEHFMLPLSHDEVVHGKGSMIRKMPGDDWQKFANLRAYYGFMWMFPGKKLVFMGDEIAQWREWNHDASLDWDLTDSLFHSGVQRLIGDLNRVYAGEPALHATDSDPKGFDWAGPDDADRSVFAFFRQDPQRGRLLVVSNMTPVPRADYQVSVPEAGYWTEILNTDAGIYGGSNLGNGGGVSTSAGDDQQTSVLRLTLPPLSTIVLKAPSGGH